MRSQKYRCINVCMVVFVVILFMMCLTAVSMADDEGGDSAATVQDGASNNTQTEELTQTSDDVIDTQTADSSNNANVVETADKNKTVEDGDYTISAHDDNNYVLDVYKNGTENDANVELYKSNGGLNQRMRIKYIAEDGGYYTISSVSSGKSLDVYNSNGRAYSNGANVQIYQYNGGLNQRWAIIKRADGGYKIKSLISGMFLEFAGGVKNESNIQVWDDTDSSNQIFDLLRLPDAPSNKTIDDGDYIIASPVNGFKVVDVYNGNSTSPNGANVEVYDANGSSAQRFHFSFTYDSVTGGYYRITHVASGKSLDVNGASLKSGANVQIWNSNDSVAQQWLVKRVSDGIFNIVMMASGNVLDISYGNLSNCTNITVYKPNGGLNQQFVLKSAVDTADITDGVYTITSSQNDNNNVSTENGNVMSGTNFQMSQSDGEAHQKFLIQSCGNGTYRIMSCASGLVMDVYNGNSQNGTNVIAWLNNNGVNQRFTIKKVGDGTYYIVASSGKIVGSSSAGTIEINEAEGKDNQKFVLTAVTDYKPIEDGAYVIESEGNSNYALDVYGNLTMQKVNIQLYNKNGQSNQIFKITKGSDDLYTIQNVYSRHVLDVDHGYLADGTNVMQYGINGGKNQKWLVIVNADGSISFINDGTGRALNISGGKYLNESNIDQWTFSGVDSQKFVLVPTTYDKSYDTRVIDYTIYSGLGLGIDVSEFQGAINWTAVKGAGITFTFIRAAFRGYGSGKIVTDSKFATNIKGAVSAGLPVGVYFFTQAINAAEGAEEADYIINLISSYNVSLPIVIDTEAVSGVAARANGLSVAQRTSAIKGFCERVVARGLTPMIYASTSWLENNLDMSQLSSYKVWVAQWNSKVTYKGDYDCWQYSDKGSVNGINGTVDMDRWCY